MNLFDFQYSSAPLLVIGVVKWLLIGLLIAASTIRQRTPLVILLITGIASASIGALFKIAHWAGADGLLIGGAALLLGTYGWWFKAKVTSGLLDYLKLAWVSGAAACLVVVALSHPLVRLVAGVTDALFWAMALLFVYRRWIRRPGPVAE
ncbi:hypothetical protein ACVWYF_000578 [Hymenobacter sp. UYAg731]